MGTKQRKRPGQTASAILAKLDAVLAEQHELRRLVHKLAVPVNVLDKAAAAARIGVSARTLERVTAAAVFTDARPPERRTAGTSRRYYADELDVYRSDGAAGVRRLRDQLGRG